MTFSLFLVNFNLAIYVFKFNTYFRQKLLFGSEIRLFCIIYFFIIFILGIAFFFILMFLCRLFRNEIVSRFYLNLNICQEIWLFFADLFIISFYLELVFVIVVVVFGCINLFFIKSFICSFCVYYYWYYSFFLNFVYLRIFECFVFLVFINFNVIIYFFFLMF